MLQPPRLLPELVQGKNIAEGPSALELDGLGAARATPERAIEAIDERIELLRFELIKPPKIGDDPLAHRRTRLRGNRAGRYPSSVMQKSVNDPKSRLS